MSADKRSVTTDALDTLGTIIDKDQKRDAIHLAVEPVIAGEDLSPGDHVFLMHKKAFRVMSGEGVGIVDPFLNQLVYEGERFWLVVYPRKITSLRHVWTHPYFDGDREQLESKRWIEKYVARLNEYYIKNLNLLDQRLYYPDMGSYNLTYEKLMTIATEWVKASDDDKEHLDFPFEEGRGLFEDEFWIHYTTVTGNESPNELRNFFSCSC